MPARIDDILVLDQHISKTELGKYLRDREHPTPSDFGGIGDGVADETAAVQVCFDRAAADGKIALIPKGTWNVASGVVLGGAARGALQHPLSRLGGTGRRGARGRVSLGAQRAAARRRPAGARDPAGPVSPRPARLSSRRCPESSICAATR